MRGDVEWCNCRSKTSSASGNNSGGTSSVIKKVEAADRANNGTTITPRRSSGVL